MSDRYVTFSELEGFAKAVGKSHMANPLWRLITGKLHAEEAGLSYPGLDLRHRSNGRAVRKDSYELDVKVSVASLKAARVKIFENIVPGYGRRRHELFTEWVDSL